VPAFLFFRSFTFLSFLVFNLSYFFHFNYFCLLVYIFTPFFHLLIYLLVLLLCICFLMFLFYFPFYYLLCFYFYDILSVNFVCNSVFLSFENRTSYVNGCKYYCLLKCDAILFDRSLPAFWRHNSFPHSI
jgi:hypothetical protein